MIVYISGVSGVGKTTLAQNLLKKLTEEKSIHFYRANKIEFISFSAKELWSKHNIKNHQDLISRGKSDINFLWSFQLELLEYRANIIKNLDPHSIYITDRSPIDNLVYTISEVSNTELSNRIPEYVKICEELLNQHPYIFSLHDFNPDNTIQDDSYRITSPYYQLMINSIFKAVVWDFNLLNLCRGCVIKLQHGEYDTNLFKLFNETYAAHLKMI
jgi:deoxyadenosine/deoxycytidine kinase